MSSLDEYTDEELGQMFRQAAREQGAHRRAEVSTLEAFCSWLNMVGLGFIADAIKVASWAWDRVKSIWHTLFG